MAVSHSSAYDQFRSPNASTIARYLPGSSKPGKTKCGLDAFESGLYRFKGRGSILNDYLCIFRGNVARPVYAKPLQELLWLLCRMAYNQRTWKFAQLWEELAEIPEETS